MTTAIVEILEEAIGQGELAPGAKLPPTRQLAEIAGVNHLTAARAYRRLADQGLVAARVGSGTFVRPAAAYEATRGGRPARRSAQDQAAWQRYALPPETETYGERLLFEMQTQAGRDDVIPLMIGYPAPDVFPVDALADLCARALREEGARAHQYGPIEGVPELREAIAERPGAQATGDDADSIIVTSGARQALTLASRAILRPGDIVAIESPSYLGVLEAIRDTGAEVVGIHVDEDGLDVDALELLLTRREIKLVALQSRLHNPTGRDLSPARRERLIELARTHGFFILDDGVYADLRFEGEHPPTLRSLDPEHVVHLSSFSKWLSPGLRVGWIAASGEVRERIAREKKADDVHAPILPQLIAHRFLTAPDHDAQLERAIGIYRVGAEAICEAVEQELGAVAQVSEPLGGGHVWVEFDAPIPEGELYSEAVRRGVSFLPGGALMPDRPRSTAMRLSFGYCPPDDLRQGVRRLAMAANAVGEQRAPRRPIALT